MPGIHEKLDKKIASGELDPEQGRRLHAVFNTLEHLTRLYEQNCNSEKSFFKPDELPSDFVVSNGPPVFFKQMAEDELKENYDVFTCTVSGKDDQFRGYCSEVFSDLRNGMAESSHRQTGLTLRLATGLQYDRTDNGWLTYMGEYERPDNPINRFEWSSGHIYGFENAPHVIVASIHKTQGREEYILRSELMILLRYMIGKTRKFVNHQITPVLSISVRAQFLRVTEAYYDGEKVHINYGPPIHINGELSQEETQRRMEGVIRWYASTPQGETENFSSLRSMERKPISAKPGNPPSSPRQQRRLPSLKGKGNMRSPQNR
ncbi:hypothetical protein FQN50_000003 [Emmonsiellopsis sp. PD_5]|nr:hypothetical protein FQN50_000003 [Emmonsiellopsis sp. PD_5]